MVKKTNHGDDEKCRKIAEQEGKVDFLIIYLHSKIIIDSILKFTSIFITNLKHISFVINYNKNLEKNA